MVKVKIYKIYKSSSEDLQWRLQENAFIIYKTPHSPRHDLIISPFI